MVLIFGLGNDENKYYNTKHNIGRLLLENIAIKLNKGFIKNNNVSLIKLDEIILLYNHGYMNTCGNSFRQYLNYHDFNNQNSTLLIIQDDSDQFVGKVKLVLNGGSGGHRGIDSIYVNLPDFKNLAWRLKIGVRPLENNKRSETFVLNKVSLIEKEKIQNLSDIILNYLEKIKQKDFAFLQNIINF